MLRWLLAVLGIGSVAFGIVGYTMHPPIPVEPRALTVEEAIALLPNTERLAVTVAGELEPGRRVYRSLVDRPHYASRPPNEVVELPAVPDEGVAALEDHLGTRVRSRGRLEPLSVSLMGVEKRTVGEDEVRSERVLAPVVGTGRRLWALSPTFHGGEEAGPRAWLAGREVEGVLSRLRDIGENTRSWRLEFGFDELRSFVAGELGHELDGGELLVIDGVEEQQRTLFQRTVAGSGGALAVTPFREGEPTPEAAADGGISGVLWVWEVEDDRRADLERLFGGPLPPRRGVIHIDESAEELNRKTTFGLKLFTGLGGVLLAFAAVGFWRRW